LGTIPKAG